MSSATSPSACIIEEVTSWSGVVARRGSGGEIAFTVGTREIGHLHGDRAAHFGFPRHVWTELVERGQVGTHPFDRDGWAARRIQNERDVREVIELLRFNYDHIVARHRPATTEVAS